MNTVATPPPSDLPAAFGRYTLLKLLGSGGMGAVYLAQDRQLDRRVAIKVPHLGGDAGPTVLARFTTEARAAAAIQHANICPIYDVGEVDGLPYLTMGFIEGQPLADFMAVHPPTARASAFLV